jgi:hypothetical protein
LDHPNRRKMMNGKELLVKRKGSFVCRNHECPLLKRKRVTQSRDKTSALAIPFRFINVAFSTNFPSLLQLQSLQY